MIPLETMPERKRKQLNPRVLSQNGPKSKSEIQTIVYMNQQISTVENSDANLNAKDDTQKLSKRYGHDTSYSF